MAHPRRLIEARAQKLLANLGFREIPVPADRIARSLGARLCYSPLDQELSGFVFIKNGVPIIGVNSLHHPNRQRFTIAHELGHLQLHPEFITTTVHVDKQFTESVGSVTLRRVPVPSALKSRPISSPRHSSCPVSFLMSYLGDHRSISKMAAQWRPGPDFVVSRAALQYRIRNV
jgi:uncharacterized protein DUF955